MQVEDIAVSLTSPFLAKGVTDRSSFEDILLAMFILKALAAAAWLYVESSLCHRVPDDPKERHSLWDEDSRDGGKPEVCGHPGTV